jgi:hypothetical protein
MATKNLSVILPGALSIGVNDNAGSGKTKVQYQLTITGLNVGIQNEVEISHQESKEDAMILMIKAGLRGIEELINNAFNALYEKEREQCNSDEEIAPVSEDIIQELASLKVKYDHLLLHQMGISDAKP